MPLYDFKCEKCSAVHEQIVDAAITMVPCRACIGPSKRLLSAPASIRMDSLAQVRKRKDTIKEPIWRYPDGHIEPVNP